MITIRDQKLKKEIEMGEADIPTISNYLLENYKMKEIVDFASEMLMNETENPTQKIKITVDQFREFFKVVGYNENGEEETRGRKPKVKQYDEISNNGEMDRLFDCATEMKSIALKEGGAILKDILSGYKKKED